MTQKNEKRPHTMAFQESLPRLPIPPIRQTLKRYLEAAVPAMENDLQGLNEACDRTAKFLPVAVRLQKRLIKYEKSEPANWLDKWWLECAYLSSRSGLCVNSSYWSAFFDDSRAYDLARAPQPLSPSDPEYRLGRIWDSKEYGKFQIRRAVKVIQGLIDYKDSIANGSYPPDVAPSGPLCMHAYKIMFGATRIPRKGCDEMCQDEKTINARTIIVIIEDQLYNLHMYDKNGNRRLDGDLEADLFEITRDVAERRNANDLDPAVTVLTAGNRDRWAEAYEMLMQQPENRATLLAIQDSLMALSLDSTFVDPHGSINALQQAAKCHGTQPGHNRWYDKCLGYIFDRNGSAGFVGEHSPYDALVPALITDKTLRKIANGSLSSDMILESTPNYKAHASRLRFTNIGSKIEKMIQEAEEEVIATVSKSVSRQIHFTSFGSTVMKSVSKVNIDSFVQFALQLAYYKTHGYMTPVYETATTRMFKQGRTDTIRSFTTKSQKFIKTMCNPDATPKQKYEAMVSAAKKHQSMAKQVSSGNGIDRHIFGLKLAYLTLPPLPDESPMTDEEKEITDNFFNEPAFEKASEFRLSTAGLIPGPYFAHTGFGTVVQERGYGISYMVERNAIKFGVEGKTNEVGHGTDVDRFCQAISESIIEIKAICEEVTGAKHPSSKL